MTEGTSNLLGDGDGIDHGPGGRIEPIDLQVSMQRSYIDYAMAVIVGRALPDVRDGLKPVHRRVLARPRRAPPLDLPKNQLGKDFDD